MHGSLPANSHTVYRSDIDGLRAIAVLSVMTFHYGAPFPWPLLPGGFTGVDVFFVISGFVITLKLSGEIALDQFSILNFYDRRVKRILPALLVMLCVTLLAGRFFLMPGDYQSLATSAAAATFGVSNFFFLFYTGYFDQSAELQPLLHTWSLAVEEQFYLVWPLLLFIVVKTRINIAAIIGAMVIIGFGASVVWRDTDPKGAFYMAAPRAWELAIGALLVFLPPLPRGLSTAATIAGLALIVTGFFTISAASFPGLRALYPCVGAALIIWPKANSKPAAWLGKLKPIGLISYSLYLWHWPVWVLFHIYINNGPPRIREAAALAAVSILLATLSYFYVEQPFRQRRSTPSQPLKMGLFACTMIFCGSMYVHSADGLPQRVGDAAYAMRSLDAMWQWDCKEQVSINGHQYCGLGAPWANSRKGVLWGDSHAEHLAPIIDAIAKDRGISFILQPTCPAAFGGHINRRWPEVPTYAAICAARRAEVLSLLSTNDIDFVVLAASWSALLKRDVYSDNGETGSKADLVRSGLVDLLKQIEGSARKIVIVGDMTGPTFDMVPCAISSDSHLFRRQCGEKDLIISSRERLSQLSRMSDALSSLSDENVVVLLPSDGMCNNIRCLTRVNGEFIFRDGSHFRRNLQPETDLQIGHLLRLDMVIQ
jgi:peptidoglycan/LPS O-acetylase OafA/YrhL